MIRAQALAAANYAAAKDEAEVAVKKLADARAFVVKALAKEAAAKETAGLAKNAASFAESAAEEDDETTKNHCLKYALSYSKSANSVAFENDTEESNEQRSTSVDLTAVMLSSLLEFKTSKWPASLRLFPSMKRLRPLLQELFVGVTISQRTLSRCPNMSLCSSPRLESSDDPRPKLRLSLIPRPNRVISPRPKLRLSRSLIAPYPKAPRSLIVDQCRPNGRALRHRRIDLIDSLERAREVPPLGIIRFQGEVSLSQGTPICVKPSMKSFTFVRQTP